MLAGGVRKTSTWRPWIAPPVSWATNHPPWLRYCGMKTFEPNAIRSGSTAMLLYGRSGRDGPGAKVAPGGST